MRALAEFLAPFAQRKVAAFGLAFLIVVVVSAVLAPWVVPYDPLELDAICPGQHHLEGRHGSPA